MNSLPSVADTLALLDDLKRAAHECAVRDERIDREHATEASKIRRQFEKATAEQADRRSRETGEADLTFQAREQAASERYEKRKRKIREAQRTAKQSRLLQVEAREGRVVYEVQRDLLQATRTRDAAEKEENEAFGAFNAVLAGEGEALTVLEGKAADALRGYGRLRRALSISVGDAEPDAALNRDQLLEQLRSHLDATERQILKFRRSILPFVFRQLPLWLLILSILLVHLLLVPVLRHFGIGSVSYGQAVTSMLLFLGGAIGVYGIGLKLAARPTRQLAGSLAKARRLYEACASKSAARHEQTLARLRNEHETLSQRLNEQWRLAGEQAGQQRETWEARIEEKAARAQATNESRYRNALSRLDRERDARTGKLKGDAATNRRQAEGARAESDRQLEVRVAAQRESLAREWTDGMGRFHAAAAAAVAGTKKFFPEWDARFSSQWTPPAQFPHATRFARLEVDLAELCPEAARRERLGFPEPTAVSLPLHLTFPDRGSLLIETEGAGREEAIGTLNNILLRLLATMPPGKVAFTLLDPVELGQNFAGIMHLTEYEERLINYRIWTQPDQIEQQLGLLGEHIEKVTQMYLRNEYANITEYNRRAGRIAEKYHFLVVADFPVNFGDVAAKRLLSIAASGPRCGVFPLVHWDSRRTLPQEFVPEELRRNSIRLLHQEGGFALADRSMPGIRLRLDRPPDADLTTEFLHRVGRMSVDSERVEMPFAEVAPPESELWSRDTVPELRVPIGRTGATRLQQLELGKGTRQHALIAGKTGSGKSNLLHVVITNLSLWCSPDRVEFYLVDFKKGVEFKCYATKRLPHARVVAIESDREFGLSVLERLDQELRRRGDLFREAGVQDLAGYRNARSGDLIPRTLLIIDEFQEFFVEDDRVSQGAALLLDRLIRQGRAFGIHVVLGSQTLGGAYTLARSTLGQMVVRIALQCNEADAYLIMEDNNSAPRLLSRPGEGIYNDAAGMVEGNSPFQVVWLPEAERDRWLDSVRDLADQKPTPPKELIVFEGNAPANVADNRVLRELLAAERIEPKPRARAFLGAPNSIKGPTEAVFQEQSGNNLLVVGQNEEAALAILGISLVSLSAQHQPGTVRFLFCNATAPGSAHAEFLERVAAAIPQTVTVARADNVPGMLTELARELQQRADSAGGAPHPAVYLFVHGLQKFRGLRYEEDYPFSLDEEKAAENPGVQLNQLICEGGGLGFHLICTCDTYNNVNRFLSRKALSEFEMRVLFQMSANDSASLIDSPKANNLGLHRAIFYNEQEGLMETFRPYALPDRAWLEAAARDLSRLVR